MFNEKTRNLRYVTCLIKDGNEIKRGHFGYQLWQLEFNESTQVIDQQVLLPFIVPSHAS